MMQFFWYALMAVLPIVYGSADLALVVRMLAVAAVCLVLYKLIKTRAARPRPFQAHTGIQLHVLPLDQHAFPSGHTMHAVAFTLLVLAQHPELAMLLVPFTVLVAVSRVALGLHYPSDVVAGAALGSLIAWVSLQF